MNVQREHWASYGGFLFASIGSAVGIGNIWRFPYLVGTNGGGAFLVPYLIVMASFGLVFLMLELAVGRYYQTSIIGSLAKIKKRFKWFGVFTVVVATAVLSYYLVILGWILAYIFFMVVFPTTFDEFTSSMFPLVSFIAILAINYFIIRRGVTKGIEKLNKYGVIILIALIVPLTIYGLTLPNSEKGVEFYLTPDFSRFVEPKIWTDAFGQVFFSLSIGFGTLVAYGSYLSGRQSLLKSSSTILTVDTLIAFIGGIMIFSILFSFGMDPDQGVSLVFQVMPKIFSEIEFGFFIGIVFFALLLVAGLTSSIGLFQVPVSALEDSVGYSKQKAVPITAAIVAVAGTFSALSYSEVNFAIFGTKFLDLMDDIFGTFGLSISAILFAIAVLWFMNKEELRSQLSLNSIRFPSWILVVAKVLLPGMIIATIIFNIFSS